MSESPERPRLTRRQLREMEQARQAAAAHEVGGQPPSPGAPADAQAAAAEPVSSPPPVRPTMTRRQLREAAEREAAERRAQEEAAEQARLAEEARSQREAEAAEQARLQAQAAAEQSRREAEAAAEQSRRAAEEQERLAAWQRAQEAPIPALETEDAPRIPTDHAAAQRLVTGQQPAQPDPQQHIAEQPPTRRPGFYPAPSFADAPVVRPPAGVNAIRTVEETGELSPILQTSPGENVWPSIPGADTETPEAAGQPRIIEPEEPPVASPAAGTAVPFRAPAWGARTSPATPKDVEQPGETDADAVGTQTGGLSGMSATPSRWPAGGVRGASSTGVSVGSSGLGASGSTFPSLGQQSTGADVDFDDEDDEEYEPMFTWLRLLVLMIIAFVLGALVWLIIGKSDAGAAAASMSTVFGLKNRLGD